jgi:hypothetical protein
VIKIICLGRLADKALLTEQQVVWLRRCAERDGLVSMRETKADSKMRAIFKWDARFDWLPALATCHYS